MSLSDELNRLADLHQRGALSDDEFARAKQRLLDPPALEPIAAKVNALRRSRGDRWIAGAGLLLYGLLWIFVPLD